VSDSPPAGLGDRLTSPVGVAIAIGCLLVLVYSVVIAQQILLGLLVVLAVVGLYVVFRLIRAIESVAEALDRQTDVALDVRDPTADDPDSPEDRQAGPVGHEAAGTGREQDRGTGRDPARSGDADGDGDGDREVARNVDPEVE
jgi:hypothetical protein